MKQTIINFVALILAVAVCVALGYIGYVLGIKLPIQLWNNGQWGWALAQSYIVWSWLLGGKRNEKN